MAKRLLSGLLSLLLLLPLMPVRAAGQETAAFGTLWQHFSRLEEQWLSQPRLITQVPQYFQTDYPDTPFGHGTIASSGCGIVCLAMVASYLTDRHLTPPQLAVQFGQLQMNNVQRIDHAIEVLNLPFALKPRNFQQMITALEQGQVVILLVNGDSVFTDGQHMLVLTGLTDTGRVRVLDPYEPNYNDVELITGYVHGFRQETLSRGFDGGWIFGQKRVNRLPDFASPFRNLRSRDW